MRHAGFELRDPFLLDIVVGSRINHREADEKDVSIGVGERPQLVVILLKQCQEGKVEE